MKERQKGMYLSCRDNSLVLARLFLRRSSPSLRGFVRPHSTNVYAGHENKDVWGRLLEEGTDKCPGDQACSNMVKVLHCPERSARTGRGRGTRNNLLHKP